MPSMDEILRQARAMQEKLARMQDELGKQTVIGTSGGGMVTVTATGKQEIVSVHIDPAVVNSEDVPMLEDLVQAAVNDALRRSKELAQNEIGSLTGGLNLPGMM